MTAPALRLAVEVRGEDVFLNSHQATSLALVVNELLQNAIEHAFPDRTDGRIEIRFLPQDGGLVLEVQDDGAGLPPGFEPTAGNDLGLKIIHALVTEDLGGSIAFHDGGGTTAVITVPRLESLRT
jgi:two-component sensor histidine kinase